MAFADPMGGGGAPVPGLHPAMASLMMRRRRRPKPFMRAPGLLGHAKRKMGHPLAGTAVAGHPIDAGPPNIDPSSVLGDRGPGNQIDPGFQIDPMGGTDPAHQAAIARMKEMADAQGMGQVSWGGQTFQDPNKLWGWELKHGNTMGKKEFWRLHPDAARRLGLPSGDDGGESPYDQAGPLDNQDQLRASIIGQMQQAQGALAGTAAPGLAHKVANHLPGSQRRRIHAVGAAQGRARALAQIMARRLRGRAG